MGPCTSEFGSHDNKLWPFLAPLNCIILHCWISSLLHLPDMDREGNDVIDFILHRLEVELGKKREKTREMAEQLRADGAALEALENKRLMLMNERDEKLAEKKAVDKLVFDFLEADDNMNFVAQRAMLNRIVDLMSGDAARGV
ncbi:hypothetical protein PVK06_040634 [Gossypium arboreum]|uniref:Uncharacterized protein n=2 Tax=Gossypium TaxID=3633 RepID=A0ABR0N6L1_GOSAR|nr:hypothetical protein PVK06_040634 [Gossypium arboreum]